MLGQQLLQEMGPTILDTLRSHLLVNSEKRLHDRLLWPHPLKIRPLSREGNVGESIQCQGKDISFSGIGFYLPEELETSDVLPEAIRLLPDQSTAIGALMGLGFLTFFLFERALVLHHRDEPADARAHGQVGTMGALGLSAHSFVDGLAFNPLGGKRGAGNGATASEGLELGVFDDAGRLIHFKLQLHDVTSQSAYLSFFGAYPFHTHSMAWGRNCCCALPMPWPCPTQKRY